MPFSFSVPARDPGSRARRGTLHTARGPVATPVFMPVGTRASVTGVSPAELRELGVPVWLANTYHVLRRPGQALFAIVQGGLVPELRRASAGFLTDHPFDGFAIGGLAVGDTRAQREDMTAYAAELLPAQAPRYLMGVGTPPDLLTAIGCGVDM